MHTRTKCLSKNCEREASCRGLCWSCYQTAIRLVRADKYTWEQFIEMGLALKGKRTTKDGAFTSSVAEVKRKLDNNIRLVPEMVNSRMPIGQPIVNAATPISLPNPNKPYWEMTPQEKEACDALKEAENQVDKAVESE